MPDITTCKRNSKLTLLLGGISPVDTWKNKDKTQETFAQLRQLAHSTTLTKVISFPVFFSCSSISSLGFSVVTQIFLLVRSPSTSVTGKNKVNKKFKCIIVSVVLNIDLKKTQGLNNSYQLIVASIVTIYFAKNPFCSIQTAITSHSHVKLIFLKIRNVDVKDRVKFTPNIKRSQTLQAKA